MAVLRIVPDFAVADPAKAKAFYGDILGLDCVMDQGWIATYAGNATQTSQISFMTEGGSGQPTPAISVEVDDLSVVMSRLKAANMPITYGPVDEPWGVRRFFVKDPFDNLINVLTHVAEAK